MDVAYVMSAVAAGVSLVLLVWAAPKVFGRLQPTIEQKRQRQLDEAQDNLLLAEASLEYYRLMTPMLRQRIKRLEAAQERAAKLRKQAAEKDRDWQTPGLG